MGSLEKKHQNEWAKELLVDLGIWSERIVDTPYLSGNGFVTQKKRFDRLICLRGIAAEFKFVKGPTFPLWSWRENEKSKHQFRSLQAFHDGKNRFGAIIFFWHPRGKRDIQIRYLLAPECATARCATMDACHDESELYKLMESLR